MMRRSYRPSSALNRSRRLIKSDNICLIPASQLPFKEEWAKVSRGLPVREALIIVPTEHSKLNRLAHALLPQLQARGRHVTTVTIGSARNNDGAQPPNS